MGTGSREGSGAHTFQISALTTPAGLHLWPTDLLLGRALPVILLALPTTKPWNNRTWTLPDKQTSPTQLESGNLNIALGPTWNVCSTAYLSQYIHMHTHMHMHTCIHTCLHAHTHTHAYICIHTYTHACMNTHMHTHTCMHMFTYTHHSYLVALHLLV